MKMRSIIVNALILGGGLALVLGLAAAALLSLRPLQRIDGLRETSRAALKGQLGVRLPGSGQDSGGLLRPVSEAVRCASAICQPGRLESKRLTSCRPVPVEWSMPTYGMDQSLPLKT